MTHPQKAVHAQSVNQKDDFWLKAAANIHWHKPPTVAYGKSQRGGEYLDKEGQTWFPDAQLNTCYNALDRHVYPPPSLHSPPLTPSPHTPHLPAPAHLANRPAFHHVSPLPFQTVQQRTITYGEALEQVQTLAGVLRHKGVKKGDAVVIYMPMIPETAIAMLACTRIGAVHSVVFGGFAPRELAKRIQDSRCALVIAASCGLEPKGPVSYKPLVDEAFTHSSHKPASGLLFLRRTTIKGHSPPQVRSEGEGAGGEVREWDWEKECEATRAGREGREREWACTPVGSEEPVYTLYTSGTTGMPKGVVRLSGGHAVALRYSIEHVFGIGKDDVMFTASDLGWVVGHSYILYAPLLIGAATVIFEGKPILPDAGILWRTCSTLGVNALFTAPTALRAVRANDPDAKYMRNPQVDLRKLRTLFLAGERSEPQIVSAYAELLKELAAPGASVNDNYWSTESGSPITALALGSAYGALPSRPGSAGLPLPGMDVRVVDDAGREVKQGEMGNLVLKTPLAPSALGGLWKNPEGFYKSYFERFDGKGDWFETGDQAIVDEDGYVTLCARSDDLINVSAHRLGTGLIEQVVTGHPEVTECCVVGAPDKLKGQSPFALVALSTSSSLSGKTSTSAHDENAAKILKSINEHVRKELGPIAQLSGLVVAAKLPKTRSGKTLRRTVRALVENAAEGKPDGPVPVPPTVEDASVVDLCKVAIFDYFAKAHGSAPKSKL